jgi:tetratricopeptide (TPR) repeat protein
MPETRTEARRLSGRLTALAGRLTALALALAVVAGAAYAASLASQVGELRGRMTRLEAGPWDAAAEQAFANDLDAAVSRARTSDPGVAADELRRLAVAAHRRHADWLEKTQKSFVTGEGEDPFESEEFIGRRQLALQTLYLRNWVDLEAATRWEPKHAERNAWLRRAVEGFGQFASLEDRAIAAESVYGRGLAHRGLGQYDAATTDLRRAIELAPDQLAARAGTVLVEMQLERDRIGDALKSSADLLAAHSSPEAEFLRAKTLLLALDASKLDEPTRGAYRAEIARLVGALEKRGGNWPALARQLVAAGITRPEEWLDDRSGATIRWTVAESLRGQGRCDEALPMYRALAKGQKSPRADLALALGECQFRAGEYAAAFDSLATVSGSGAVATDAAYLRFKAAEALGHGEASAQSGARLETAARGFVEKYPEHERAYEARFRLGELERSRGNRLAAAEQFDAVGGDPTFRLQAAFQSAQCWVEEWEIRERRDDGSAAELTEGTLERLDRFLAEAQALRSGGKARQADATMLAPTEARARVMSALIRTRLGGEQRFGEAIAALDAIDAQDLDAALRAQAAAVRATALLGLGRYAEANTAVADFLAEQQGSDRDYDLMRGLGVRTLELAAERAAAGDAANAAALHTASLRVYEKLLAAAESGRLAVESPEGLRQLVTRLRSEAAAAPTIAPGR